MQFLPNNKFSAQIQGSVPHLENPGSTTGLSVYLTQKPQEELYAGLFVISLNR